MPSDWHREGQCGTQPPPPRCTLQQQQTAVGAASSEGTSSLNYTTDALQQFPIISASTTETLAVHIALDVCWTSAETGRQSAKRLPLHAISSISDLRGLFRSLMCGAFPLDDPAAIPDYLSSDTYYKFSPAEEYATFPGDAIDTRFRLVAKVGGWEMGVAERVLGQSPDPERRLLVTVAEFESEPMELSDGTEVIVTMVTYPTVSVQKELLDGAVQTLAAMAKTPCGIQGRGSPPLPPSSSAPPGSGLLEDDATSSATRAQLQF